MTNLIAGAEFIAREPGRHVYSFRKNGRIDEFGFSSFIVAWAEGKSYQLELNDSLTTVYLFNPVSGQRQLLERTETPLTVEIGQEPVCILH